MDNSQTDNSTVPANVSNSLPALPPLPPLPGESVTTQVSSVTSNLNVDTSNISQNSTVNQMPGIRTPVLSQASPTPTPTQPTSTLDNAPVIHIITSPLEVQAQALSESKDSASTASVTVANEGGKYKILIAFLCIVLLVLFIIVGYLAYQLTILPVKTTNTTTSYPVQ